ncbi:unnamed protein product [Arabis nemorensis]|uniref:Nucleotidyl transferase domain-containing protein n=1 Tax=Arabis nemorensis TaxID=586526 RepID=A0A565C5G3_9BRAS|nr:unnamed protein product [Arabis nemorensis]
MPWPPSSYILPKLSFQNVDKRFWGEKINNNGFFKRFASDSGSKKLGNRKFKHSSVYAVAASKNPKETMVCGSVYSLLLKWHYACYVSIRFIDSKAFDVLEKEGRLEKRGCNHSRSRQWSSTLPFYKENRDFGCKFLRLKIIQVPLGGCYRLIDILMSNCIDSCISKIFMLTQFNSVSLNRHLARTYFGNDINFGGGFVGGKKWFQGTAHA